MTAKRTARKPAGKDGTAEPDRSTRGRILSAAERLFAEDGFAGVSMPEIAKASGITAGAIYKHFDSKEDLFFEVVRRTVQTAPVPLDGQASIASDFPRIAARYTTEPLKLLRQMAVEVHSASAKHPKVRKLLRQSLEHRIGELRTELAAGQRDGSIAPGPDPGLLAHAAMVFVLGLMHMETLAPQLVGDAAWQDFVADRSATLLGIRRDATRRS